MVLAAMTLAGCTIEVGPPPESDPPLVPESAKAPPPPPQPTEPQAWSRDLDLDSGPTTIDRKQLAEGLVASDAQSQYSEQRLTFQSAFEEEKKITEAERLRQQARERAEAAGLPAPPEVNAAPVEEVSAESLDGPGEAAAPRRQSRLPPPPKFPPLPAETASAEPAAAGAPETEMAAADPAMAAGTETPGTASDASQDPWAQRKSRLPAPPKFPPAPQENGAAETAAGPDDAMAAEPAVAEAAEAAEAAPGDTQLAAVQAEPAAPAAPEAVAAAASAEPAADAAASFAAEAWDAPSGTILVQVSAVPDPAKVAGEWQRLQNRFPEVLEPLRLVVEQAVVGERTAFYRVQAGGFGSEAGAEAACQKLISAGQSCFVMVR